MAARRKINELALLVGSRIRTIRRRLGVTARDLAEEAEIEPGHLTSIENGRYGISLATLAAIARKLRALRATFVIDPTAGGVQATIENLLRLRTNERRRVDELIHQIFAERKKRGG